MELYLIRHAQSANNAKPEAQRIADAPLTNLGQEQARRLATWLTSLRLTRLITSPFLRTLQTAENIRVETGITPEVRIQLHEQGGCYSGYLPSARIGQPGLTRSEIQQQFPEFSIDAALDGEGWWRRQPYESRDRARLRARSLLQRTRDEFQCSSERVGFVMHADIKVMLLECFHSDPLDTPYNSSVTRICITPNQLQLVDYNRVDHLPEPLITC